MRQNRTRIAIAALYLCVDIFLIFHLHFPHDERITFAFIPIYFGSGSRSRSRSTGTTCAVIYKFSNIYTHTHYKPSEFVACESDFSSPLLQFSFFFVFVSVFGSELHRKSVCDSARCQRKTVWPLWKYFRAEIFPRTELREKLKSAEKPQRSRYSRAPRACVYFRQAGESVEEALRDSAGSPQPSLIADRCVCKLQ